MANSLTLSAYLPIKALILGGGEFTPIFEYRDGVKTDIQKTTDQGQPLYAMRNVTALVDGEQDQVTLQTTTPVAVDPGSVISPSEDADTHVTVRATTETGSRFASLALTVFASEWARSADLSDVLA